MNSEETGINTYGFAATNTERMHLFFADRARPPHALMFPLRELSHAVSDVYFVLCGCRRNRSRARMFGKKGLYK